MWIAAALCGDIRARQGRSMGCAERRRVRSVGFRDRPDARAPVLPALAQKCAAVSGDTCSLRWALWSLSGAWGGRV